MFYCCRNEPYSLAGHEGQNKADAGLRAKALSRAVSGAPFVIIRGERGAGSFGPPEDFKRMCLPLGKGQRIEINKVMEKLALAGYQRNETVQETGEFAVRGGIVDILVLMAKCGARGLFWR